MASRTICFANQCLDLLRSHEALFSFYQSNGGATKGLMGVIADTVLQKGGRVRGVIPKALQEKEIAHEQLTELRVVDSMHDRKSLMAILSDGFVAMPGPPVEAAIALSIVFVAAEVIHSRQGKPGLTERFPWVVAFTFGLLHGFGFLQFDEAVAVGVEGLELVCRAEEFAERDVAVPVLVHADEPLRSLL